VLVEAVGLVVAGEELPFRPGPPSRCIADAEPADDDDEDDDFDWDYDDEDHEIAEEEEDDLEDV